MRKSNLPCTEARKGEKEKRRKGEKEKRGKAGNEHVSASPSPLRLFSFSPLHPCIDALHFAP
jgi:hypothetical protein